MKRLLAAVLVATAIPVTSLAQTYPTKPVHIVVPFAPGGPTDALARVVGQGLAEAMGQPFIADNKAGAAGNIGVDQIAKATADGYTIGVVPAGNIAVNPTLYANLPYKQSELQPITMLATVENVLVVNESTPAKNLKDLLALAAQKPGTLSFASPGAGSQAHLAGELMALNSKVQLLHVPYKGTTPALNDLLGGQVTMMFAQMSSALPYIKAGKLRAIGVASLQRSAVLPDVPTIAEQGLPDFEAVSWYALMAPTGTPMPVVDKLQSATATVLAKPEVKERLSALGFETGGGKPQALAATIKTETARWADVLKKRNIRIE